MKAQTKNLMMLAAGAAVVYILIKRNQNANGSPLINAREALANDLVPVNTGAGADWPQAWAALVNTFTDDEVQTVTKLMVTYAADKSKIPALDPLRAKMDAITAKYNIFV